MVMTAPTAQVYQPAPEYYLPQESGIEIKDLLAILRRRIWLIASTVILLTTLAILAGLQITPKYTASAMIMLDPRQSNVVDLNAVIQGLGTDDSTVQSQVQVLSSRFQLEQLANKFDILRDPEFNETLRNPTRDVDYAVDGPVSGFLSWLPDSWLVATGLANEQSDTTLPGGNALEDERQKTIEAFAERFKAAVEGRSYVIRVSFTSEDPAKAAKIANAAAGLYVDGLREEKVGKTDRSTRWLGDRLEVLRAEVEQADAAVERYRIKHKVTEAQGVSLNEARLFDLNQKLSGLRADAAAVQAKLVKIQAMRGRGFNALEAVPEVLSSTTIINLRERETELLREEAELRSTYGMRHPRILILQDEKRTLEKKLEAEVGRIIETIENEGDLAAERIKALGQEIAMVQDGTIADREAAVDLRELEREAEAAKLLYTSFLQRYKETQEQSELIEADAKVVSVASAPSKPSTPGPKLFGAVGFVGSIMAGTLLALLLERLDSGMRSAKQVETTLGLPSLSLVPRLDRLRRNQKPHQYMLAKPLSAYTESMRALYTSLQLSNVDRPPQVVLVTSSLPQEGKSTLALSLATFATNSSGRRVLLIDCDLRHPSVHRDLGTKPTQGLVEYMAGERALDEVIVKDEASGLDYLPICRQTSNPTDLLGSQKMKLLMAELRGRYDFIVIDSAPLLGVTDSKMAALNADKVLFAMRWDKTGKDTAINALAHLREAKASVAGVVLTMVDVRKHASYGYGDVGQYYGKYQKYYVN